MWGNRKYYYLFPHNIFQYISGHNHRLPGADFKTYPRRQHPPHYRSSSSSSAGAAAAALPEMGIYFFLLAGKKPSPVSPTTNTSTLWHPAQGAAPRPSIVSLLLLFLMMMMMFFILLSGFVSTAEISQFGGYDTVCLVTFPHNHILLSDRSSAGARDRDKRLTSLNTANGNNYEQIMRLYRLSVGNLPGNYLVLHRVFVGQHILEQK